jgi:3',5'-cyclic AMP phosphodiesterase CpdA
MFKLAHISDIHLGPLPRLTLLELASKRITGFVNWHRNRRKHLFPNALIQVLDHMRASAPDHLAITGDLVNLASRTEIVSARDWLEMTGTPLQTSVVPGNHDAYVRGALERSLTLWHDYVRGDNGPAKYDPDIKLFPYMRRREQVALIGCSSAIATPPLSAAGFFSPRQARETARLLREAKDEGLFRVVMIHHPPVRGAAEAHKRLVGIGRFQEMLEETGAELVIHGHTHVNSLFWLNGAQGRIPVVGISSASQGPGGRKPRAGYNLFKITGSPDDWLLRQERYQLNDLGTGMEQTADVVLIGPGAPDLSVYSR